jgi:hypothetical protein
MEYLDDILAQIPILIKSIKENSLTVAGSILFALFAGTLAYPLVFLYRNDTLLLEMLNEEFGGDNQSFWNLTETDFTGKEISIIESFVYDSLYTLGANRVTFSVVQDDSRILLFESYLPYEKPLPLGYRVVDINYLDYQILFNNIRQGQCITFYLNDVDEDNYILGELNFSDANILIACPSKNSNWLLSAYFDVDNNANLTSIEWQVKNLVSQLESKLREANSTSKVK